MDAARSVTRWASAMLAGLVAVLGAVALLALPAGAHAVVLDTTPEDGEELEAAPDEVVLTFNEPMQAPATIDVTDPEDADVTAGDIEIDGEQVSVPLGELSVDGEYTVEWRAVSADDHPISGEFAFEVTGVETAEADGPGDGDDPAGDEVDEPTPASEPVDGEGAPEAGDGEDSAQASDGAAPATADDGGGLGTVPLLLGAAALLGVVATAAAVRAQRRGAGTNGT